MSARYEITLCDTRVEITDPWGCVLTIYDGAHEMTAGAIRQQSADIAELSAVVVLLTHKVICCGVAASHPNAALTTTGAYADKWDSPQAESVRKLRAERDQLRAELAAAVAERDRLRRMYVESTERLCKENRMMRARLAELERAAKELVAWMWNDELGIPHASAGSKKPIWLESSASAEYIKQANLRPLYAVPPAPVAEIREPTPEECERIGLLAGRVSNRMTTCAEEDGRELFDAVRDVMCPKEGL